MTAAYQNASPFTANGTLTQEAVLWLLGVAEDLTAAQETISAQTAQIEALEARVTALEA